MENKNSENPPQQHETAFMPVNERRGILLANLDRMEQELERMHNEPTPHTPMPLRPDKLDAYEETLKNIALTLDTLLADLLEAEVREYTCQEFPPSDETDLSWKNTAAVHAVQSASREKEGRSVHEILVIATLVAAVFFVGMTFGLWGSFFFGL